MALRIRALTAAEASAMERLARSRTAPARLVERAKVIRLARQGGRVPAIARELRRDAGTVRHWRKRFNERGVEGLADAPRSGRPAT